MNARTKAFSTRLSERFAGYHFRICALLLDYFPQRTILHTPPGKPAAS
jgi:hypothetical protein